MLGAALATLGRKAHHGALSRDRDDARDAELHGLLEGVIHALATRDPLGECQIPRRFAVGGPMGSDAHAHPLAIQGAKQATPGHRPQHRRGPLIDSNWPDPPPIPDPIRFSPRAHNPPWPSLARDAKTPGHIAPRADEGSEKSPIPGPRTRVIDTPQVQAYLPFRGKKGLSKSYTCNI